MRPVNYEDGVLKLIDQRKLPREEVINSYTNYRDIARAIATMEVRGAPAIGVTAAYGVYFGALEYITTDKEEYLNKMETVCSTLRGTRPTAVNLFWAIARMEDCIKLQSAFDPTEITKMLLLEAHKICKEDIAMCKAIGFYGQQLLRQNDVILTHCNAGALATADYGTALGVIRAAYDAGKNIKVFADETRPFLQGARLTAYELQKDGIPVTLITDNMAGWLMKCGEVNAVVVGADRIASNGDVANKIGTYSLSILAKKHKIPFYVAAPTSTIDFSCESGEKIVIEERDSKEVTEICGIPIAPEGVPVRNPSFDITNYEDITAIITEKGVLFPPFKEQISGLILGE